MRIMLQMEEKKKKKKKTKKKKKKQVVNQSLLLVTYHKILSIDISFSRFILLILLHYILGWMGCFSEAMI